MQFSISAVSSDLKWQIGHATIFKWKNFKVIINSSTDLLHLYIWCGGLEMSRRFIGGRGSGIYFWNIPVSSLVGTEFQRGLRHLTNRYLRSAEWCRSTNLFRILQSEHGYLLHIFYCWHIGNA